MKRFLLIIFLVLASITSVIAGEYHTFGRNPMVPGGLRAPVAGSVFLPTPRDFPAVRMWGASGESSVKILPAGTLVECFQQQISGQNYYVASRVVVCGNRITQVMWPAPNVIRQEQRQKQELHVHVTINMPQPPPDHNLYMNSKMGGATYGSPQYLNVGSGQFRTVTWTSVNQKINTGNSISNNNANSQTQGQNQNQQQQQQQDQNQNQQNNPNTTIDVNNNNANTNTNNNINQNENINNNANANSN